MAALVAGVKYGLSSQEPNFQDKSLIFVKLTDSALRAIEEHLKNAAKSSGSPSIQFLGNEGHLTIPSHEVPGGQARFNFSISSDEDKQGSFECVQMTGQRSLAALGALTCKMRIQAKEDVYEATRHRVAAAEEQQKKNCTQVIKQSDLGKTKGRRSTKWEEHRNERIAAATAAAQNGPGGRREYSRTRPPASTSRETNLLGLSAKSSSPNNSYQRSNPHPKSQTNPDISKRPLKERLIHLLALRTYKKLELYDRAVRDGWKGSSSSQLFWMQVNQVATFKANVYQLKREMWAEVQEEWPFYTEQDRALLKRRKPQNLTPPGNSDGGSSVSSGQSPTSTHPGSPPSIISGISNKRPGYYESADGFQTKRQRISHYVKPEPPPTNSPNLFSSGLPSLDMDSDCPTRPSNSPSRNERVPRPDRNDWSERSDWNDRLDRQDRDPVEKSDRPNQMGWNERNDWNDRGERTERNNDRAYRIDRPERFDRSERKDWNERSEWNRDRRAYDNSCDQENQFQYKTDSTFKKNSDNSAKEKFAQKSESVNADSASRMGDTKVNGLSSDSRGRSFNSSSDRDRLATSSTLPKDRLSPLPRPRNSGRDGYNGSDSLMDSRTNCKQVPGETRNLSLSRRPGEDPRDGRDSRDRVLTQMSSSRAQESHHDNFDKNQLSANSRLSAVQDAPRSDKASQYTYPEFLKEYTKIENGEQRRQYKADFNKDYREYQTLHQMVERVSQHFAQLEKRLRQEKEGSDGYKRIKNQIVQEYYANKKDAKLNESKKRFTYLHDKLSHIKKLVQEYDTSTQKGNADS
ncbi:RNA polymerase II elongation factor Ell [Frankliniella occidentalis]|uniref:RNA polymerase II elongation factor Ell n=1 Tax=Frankliniella occidentalis TaxID=133901 RepID=A0A6J1TBA8_FRAOC|nr:RNA polymerase II elongation factor Ell [Frankliniella occidentalis]